MKSNEKMAKVGGEALKRIEKSRLILNLRVNNNELICVYEA